MQPSPRTTAAIKNRDRLEHQLEQARAELRAAVLEDIKAGVRQADLVRAGAYTRERIRQITREAALTS